MNLRPHKITREHATEPLHQLLLNFGKGLWQWPLSKRDVPQTIVDVSADVVLAQRGDDSALKERIRVLTIKQLTTHLRMQQEEGEDMTMLDSLESLVLAGEIGFQDFIGRVQNLFPKEMAVLDVSLRMKVASLMM